MAGHLAQSRHSDHVEGIRQLASEPLTRTSDSPLHRRPSHHEGYFYKREYRYDPEHHSLYGLSFLHGDDDQGRVITLRC